MSPIIDFHVHIYPDELAATVVSELQSRCGFQPCFDGTLSGLRLSMQTCGIDISVLQPVATKPSQVRHINQWSAVLNTESDLIAFGALHPDLSVEEVEAEIEFFKTHEIRGVKMHPEYQEFYPDDPRLEVIYQALEKNKIHLLLHAGMDLGFAPPAKATPERILQIHKGFPKLTIIAAHLGGFQMWEEVGKYLVGTPVFLDTAYCLQDAPSPQLLELIRAHGYQRVLFGSDAPWGNQSKQVYTMKNMPLPPLERAAMLGGNAFRLLGV